MPSVAQPGWLQLYNTASLPPAGNLSPVSTLLEQPPIPHLNVHEGLAHAQYGSIHAAQLAAEADVLGIVLIQHLHQLHTAVHHSIVLWAMHLLPQPGYGVDGNLLEEQKRGNRLQQLLWLRHGPLSQLTLFLTLLMQVCSSDLIVVNGTWVRESNNNVMHLQSGGGWDWLQVQGPHVSAQVCYARFCAEVLCLKTFWMQPYGCS